MMINKLSNEQIWEELKRVVAERNALQKASIALLDEYWKNYGRPGYEFISSKDLSVGRQHIPQVWVNLRAALSFDADNNVRRAIQPPETIASDQEVQE